MLQKQLRILLAEDMDDLRKVITSLFGLINLPIQIVEARDANEGSEILLAAQESREPFNIVCTDIHLGRTSGMVLLSRAAQLNKETKRVAFSGGEIHMSDLIHYSMKKPVRKSDLEKMLKTFKFL